MAEDKSGAQAGPDSTPKDRDFGDSAGYGSGGSTKDYHEVGDEAGGPVKNRRNPLDDVVQIKNPIRP